MSDLLPDTRVVRARAKLRRAEDLEDERPGEALTLCDGIIADLGSAVGTAAGKRLAEALFLKSQVLIGLGRVEEGLTGIVEMRDRFGGAGLPLRRRVAHALWFIVLSLRPDRTEAALALCREARDRYAGEDDPCILDRLLCLFVEEAAILDHLNRREEGRMLRDALTARFEGVADPQARGRADRLVTKMSATFA